MTSGDARAFRLLTADAVRDGVRRRIVPVVVLVSLLSLLAVDSCTSCAVSVARDGQAAAPVEVGTLSGTVIFAVLALWTMVLAAVLASDHLAEPLGDGSATLLLARPVRRATFALSRLAGGLAIALATGVVLLGATALLLQARHGVDAAAAVWSVLACAGGSVVTGALAMTLSLTLPRAAVALLAMAGVAVIAVVNGLSLFGHAPGGIAGILDRYGPPLLSAVVVPVAAWAEPFAVPGDALALGSRLAVWAAASAALLVVAFRRREL
jgi:ABC-type transport system involved in multi-copper enzyme maturation permease subunit